jgi:hypothetical protein
MLFNENLSKVIDYVSINSIMITRQDGIVADEIRIDKDRLKEIIFSIVK